MEHEKRPSFQLKLALRSTLISSVVVITSAVLIWHFTKQIHRAQLDRDLSDLAFQILVLEHIDLHELEAGRQPPILYGPDLHGGAILVQDRTLGQHASPHWPADLPQSALPVAIDAKYYVSSGLTSADGGHHHDEPLTGHDTRPSLSGADRDAVQPRFATVQSGDEDWRIVGLRLGERTLHAAIRLNVLRSNLAPIRTVIILTAGLAIAALALSGWWMARKALRPVRAVTAAAEDITAVDLSRRIADEGADREFARLIHVFNEMLERLERSFRQATRFSADASHELKTPLTIMQGEVETALQAAPQGSPEQVALASQLEEIQRLKHMVRKLLLLSHADSGALRPDVARLDLAALVRQVFEDVPDLDPALRVECLAPEPVEVEADRTLLLQVVQNMATNAVTHNHPGGWIRCDVGRKGSEAILRVANSSDVIPGALHERIFDRFYRVDGARSGEGSGLGLSLAREIVRAHGGELRLASSDIDGTVFELRLPLASSIPGEVRAGAPS